MKIIIVIIINCRHLAIFLFIFFAFYYCKTKTQQEPAFFLVPASSESGTDILTFTIDPEARKSIKTHPVP